MVDEAIAGRVRDVCRPLRAAVSEVRTRIAGFLASRDLGQIQACQPSTGEPLPLACQALALAQPLLLELTRTHLYSDSFTDLERVSTRGDVGKRE